MKKIISVLILTSLLIVAILSFSSCNENGGDEQSPAVSGKTLVLNVYNWGEYISDGSLGTLDVNAEFEKYYKDKFGIEVKVNYTTYATNEDMYSKITSGAGSYDVIVPSDYMIEKLKNEGYLYKFDPSTLPNYKYIIDSFKKAPYDPNGEYTVPYTYGMLAIIYNTALVDEEDYADKSWSLLWNEKYRGKILQFNNQRDAFGTAMYYNNLDVNSTDKAVWDLALDSLVKQKALVQGYVNDEIFNKMTTASAAIAPYFAGDFLTMAADNEDLAFYYPKEGTNYFVDAMCIPANAKNKELAKEYINFMLSEDIAVANAAYIGYASPNKLVIESEEYAELMTELHEDAMEILYGVSPEDANVNYSYDPIYRSFDEDTQAYINSLWESLKTENSTEAWVHATCAIIIVSVIGLATWSIVVRKIRSRDYRLRDKEALKAKKMSSVVGKTK